MKDRLLNLFHYYIENQKEILKKYNGKVIILKDFEVVGAYDNEWDAYETASEKYKPGTFIIQDVSPGTEAYTVVISSSFVYQGS